MVNSATMQFTFRLFGLRPQGLNGNTKSGQLTCYKSGQFNLLPTLTKSLVFTERLLEPNIKSKPVRLVNI